MKKLSKKLLISLVTLILSFVFCLSACSGDTDKQNSANQSGSSSGADNQTDYTLTKDNYDNFYEIFVYSFCDSDGDGIGDLRGVTSKLDYVRQMGYTGIWLMPINPSPSYHKYNVTDYKAIDPVYGTMEDFEALVDKAHSLGIKVIIDLVLNHSSASHPWFEAALKAFESGDTENEYYDYYTFSRSYKSGYRAYGNGVYAEAFFDQDMPDLNLDSQGVRAEFEDIISFWIKNKGIDGFRLDAVRYFYTGDAKKSAEFTGWVKERADAAIRSARNDISARAFIVGEDWSTATELKTFYQYGKGASFFDFQVQGGNGYIARAIEKAVSGNAVGAADDLYSSFDTVIGKALGYVPACFLGNHDLARFAEQVDFDEMKIKFAYGLLSLYSGSIFAYYGDEIGMSGSVNDPEKRVGMLWSDDTAAIYPPGAREDRQKYYHFSSVEDQLSDKSSILNYYKLCNNTRNAFTALSHGVFNRISVGNENVLVFTKSYKTETVTVAVNFSAKTESVELSGEIKAAMLVSGNASKKAKVLQIPAYGIVILQ